MKVHHRRSVPDADEVMEFGEKVTADTPYAPGERSQGRQGEKYAVVVLDLGTGWCKCEPCCERSSRDAVVAFQRFAGPGAKIRSFYSASAKALLDEAKTSEWCHTTNTPYVSCTNGRVGRRMRLLEEGTRTLLVQAGLPHRWWPHAWRDLAMA